jgi:soluble lytic murein transglycosylase-like protein
MKTLALSLLASTLFLASASTSDADVLFFANGRTISVKNHRVEGDTITVTFRNGGEATFQLALVARIAADEIPDPEPVVAPTEPVRSVSQSRRRALESRPYAALIETVASKHGVDPALVHAVVEAESNYYPLARSPVGARGLMQVMPATAKDLGVRSTRLLFDPQENLEAGVKYLKWLLERFNGDLPSALAAYNAGPGNVQKYDGIPPFRETEDYVRKVLSNVQQ